MLRPSGLLGGLLPNQSDFGLGETVIHRLAPRPLFSTLDHFLPTVNGFR